MPDVPISSPLSYLGMLLLLFGLLLILAGLNIFEIKQIIVKPGIKTWVVGIVLVALGVVLLLPEIRRSLLSFPTATVVVSIPTTSVSVTESPVPPTNTPQPPTPTPSFGVGSTMVREKDGMLLVYVPTGTFQMGRDERDPDAREDEKPPHPVTLNAFWIDRYEVSNAQYTRCVEAKACQGSAYANDPTYSGADYPVVGVSWQDAVDYCAWAGGRLPTEAEWEYAARGPDEPIYPWGDTFDSSKVNAMHSDDGYERTAPVGSFPAGASWVGALHMAGNVFEWVSDWHGDDYYDRSPAQNPTGPETGSAKVLRGGSWHNSLRYVRAAGRLILTPGNRDNSVGFRCVVLPGD